MATSKKGYHYLDLMRGLSALLVFSGHLRSILFVPYTQAISDPLGKAFYFFTGFGHQCVIIFFVLSGFFITKTIHNSLHNNTWTFTNYFIDRLVRLWVVLAPTLVITLFADQIGMHYFPNSTIYLGELDNLPDTNPAQKSGTLDFIGNLFFLQNIFVPTYGSNAPLWSLSYEFWYYVIFPLFLFTAINHYNGWRRLTFLVMMISILFMVGWTISIYFTIWLSGALSYYLSSQYLSRSKFEKVLPIFSTIIFFSILILIRLEINNQYFNDFTLGLSSAILTFSLSRLTIENNILLYVSNFFSKISFSLYAVHLPITIMICTVIFKSRFEWSYPHLLTYIILMTIILTIVTVFWYFFERRTPFIKQRLKLLLKISGKE